MLIKTLDRWQIKPKKWGPFSLARQAIYKNGEKIYGIESNRIAMAFPMWEKAGNKIYDYSKYEAHGDFAGDVTWDKNKINIGTSEDRITADFTNTNPAIGAIFFGFTPNWDYDDGLPHIFIDTAGGGNRRFLIYKNADNKTYFYTDTTLRGSFEFSWQAQKQYNCVLIWGVNYFLIDGIVKFIGTPGSLGLSGDTLFVGDGYTGANVSLNGKYEYFFVLNECPTLAQARLFNDRPFGLFEKPKEIIYFYRKE